MRDITDCKQADDVLKARLRLSQFADQHVLDELLLATLDEAEGLTGSRIGFFHFLEADQKTLRLQVWSTNTVDHMCQAEGKGRHYDVEQGGVWVDCVRVRQPVVHNDYLGLTGRRGLPPAHAPILRELVVPVLRGDLIVAILGVGNKPSEYDARDVEAVSQLANLAWEVVLRSQAELALLQSKEAVEAINRELEQALERERLLARTDSLTGVYNRRYFFELANREFGATARYGHPLAAMLFDIDHFKLINDTHGHLVGDEVLQRVAQVVRSELREVDILARYGGEEFIGLLPHCDAQQAALVAERIRHAVARPSAGAGAARVTVSVGVAEARLVDDSLAQLIQRADQAMYTAKAAGRNCIIVDSPASH